jgi:hypothetical protein
MNIVLKAYFPLLLFALISGKIDADSFDLDSTQFSSFDSDSLSHNIYKSLNNSDLSFETFSYAFRGYWQIVSKDTIDKKNILTIIDFNKSSTKKRFFIIDLDKQKIIHESLVAHGKNSGWDIPSSFSNMANSHKSSLGFYLTAETYSGQHGLSLRLDGLEKNINDNARKRHIVIHRADYVSSNFIDKYGRLGRSFGCPSLPSENYQTIIDLIKDESIIFIYSNQKEYFSESDYL